MNHLIIIIAYGGHLLLAYHQICEGIRVWRDIFLLLDRKATAAEAPRASVTSKVGSAQRVQAPHWNWM